FERTRQAFWFFVALCGLIVISSYALAEEAADRQYIPASAIEAALLAQLEKQGDIEAADGQDQYQLKLWGVEEHVAIGQHQQSIPQFDHVPLTSGSGRVAAETPFPGRRGEVFSFSRGGRREKRRPVPVPTRRMQPGDVIASTDIATQN